MPFASLGAAEASSSPGPGSEPAVGWGLNVGRFPAPSTDLPDEPCSSPSSPEALAPTRGLPGPWVVEMAALRAGHSSCLSPLQRSGGRHGAGHRAHSASPVHWPRDPNPLDWPPPTLGRTLSQNMLPGRADPSSLEPASAPGSLRGWAKHASLQTLIYFRIKCITPGTCQPRPTMCTGNLAN